MKRKVVDYLGNEITLKNKNAEVFVDWVEKNYDISERAIRGKLYHTLRVADWCEKIADRLGLDKDLCYNIGLFHDFARFDQWRRFQSFRDHMTVDHADESARLLFDEHQISMFDLDEKLYDVVKIAIEEHNKKEINMAKVNASSNPEYCLVLSKLIRDCDKLDIIYRFGIGDINNDFARPGVSPKCLDAILKGECVDKRDASTSADDVLTLVGYLNDIAFPETLQSLDLDGIFDGVEKYYVSKLATEDRGRVRTALTKAKEILKARAGETSPDNLG